MHSCCDNLTLTVTYYDMSEDPETFEPYTDTINILEDGTDYWLLDEKRNNFMYTV